MALSRNFSLALFFLAIPPFFSLLRPFLPLCAPFRSGPDLSFGRGTFFDPLQLPGDTLAVGINPFDNNARSSVNHPPPPAMEPCL